MSDHRRGLRVPVAGVSGQDEALPALSARADEVSVALRAETVDGEPLTVELDGSTFEINVENATGSAITVHFMAVSEVPEFLAGKVVALVTQGFRRRVPAGATLIETRACVEGDTLLVLADGVATVSVHVHGGAA